MSKINALNLGCGTRFHKEWYNVDVFSSSEYVQQYNLLNGIPYNDNTFETVYHSHFLEHLNKVDGKFILDECYRVLKPNGIIRVVVPNLENIIMEYQYWLQKCLDNPDKLNEANYDWIIIELFDQVSRNHGGGDMFDFIKNPELINKKYVLERGGYIVQSIIDYNQTNVKRNISFILQRMSQKLKKIKLKLCLSQEERKFLNIGKFRCSGEVHYTMYDRYSLKRILDKVGFKDIKLMTPNKSQIENWNNFNLDEKNGVVFSPNSLIIEGRK